MSTFYNKFKEEEEERKKLKEEEALRIQLLEQNINNQKLDNSLIIKKKSTFKNFIIFLISAFLFCIKSLFYIAITIFSSIGLTILLNESLRNNFIEFIKLII